MAGKTDCLGRSKMLVALERDMTVMCMKESYSNSNASLSAMTRIEYVLRNGR